MLKLVRSVIGDDIKKLYFPIFLMVIDSFGAATIIGVLYRVLMDVMMDSFTFQRLKVYSLIMIGAFVFRCTFIAWGYTMNHLRGADVIKDMRVSLGDYIKSLNLGYFNKNSIGSLMNILTSDVNDFERVLTHSLGDLIKAIIVTVYITIISFVINPQLAAAQLITVLLGIPMVILSGKMVNKFGLRKKVVMNEVISRMIEYINGIKVFKSYNQTGEKFDRLEKSFQRFKKESIKIEVAVAPFVMAFSIIVDFVLPVILLFGTYLILGGNIDERIFITFLMLSLALSNILKGIAGQYSEYRYLKLAATRIHQTYQQEPLDYSQESGAFRNFDIVFQDVTFCYEDQQAVLNHVNFIAKEGTMTALVGPSGAGKTTITSLIARFWDVTSGRITIGGVDISTLNPDYLLKNISIVFQDVYLLNDTIYNNIKLGNPQASQTEVIRAAKLANCNDFINSLSRGYETMVGEGGSTLSGGEKQRISIARAILKNAPIILLDEATASLDADNEIEIRKSIEELVAGKTVIVIAHKLNTIKKADQIIVLNQGRIEEIGNHEKLIKNAKRYCNMYQEQMTAKEWVI